ncbi:uncharacterized protein LOC126474750, partial [Schistocerca serialis cubense]|uniref:uncharacterized protein LOC126474750 n=1 Tax=Schistocerca serialis cubense TaxID=2023355 RepID=UPI00214F3D50
AGAGAVPACRISEFPCRNGRCVRLDRYCDGADHCGDASDEPRSCTPCNRTFYGELGHTYELDVHRPREERLPFLCHLTFTANGHSHGDLVQLIFDQFSVGRFEESALDGCPDGSMQLSELGRPFTGGSWCGGAQGHAVYYSETSTVTVSLRLLAMQPSHPFAFRLRFKFVSRQDAVVRFGSVAAPLERGEAVPGTYCSRNFYECYRKTCRLQSPNYPGMYPRNVTCYLTLRQKVVPACKHAMLSVRQEHAHKLLLKRSAAAAAEAGAPGRPLRAWSDCTGDRDQLIFYDGASTDDPVLAKVCGGEWLPAVVARGPEMLVAFHSSPFSAPLHAHGLPSPLRGFELEVSVVFSDSDSLDFSRDPRRCEFVVNASSADSDEVWTLGRGRAGTVLSPRHTLPPNTTCRYLFAGQPQDVVWLYFVSYSQQPLLSAQPPQPQLQPHGLAAAAAASNATAAPPRCSTRLRIWDGGGVDWLSALEPPLLGDHCDGDPPRLCDQSSLSNATRITRPCSDHESYLSTGATLSIAHTSVSGTALHPASFRLRYEFVDTRLGGEPLPGRRHEPCARLFRRTRAGHFWSPRNVRLFGRGGATQLSCLYRIEAAPGEKVRLTLHNASFGDGWGAAECVTEADPHTGRPQCVRQADSGVGGGVNSGPWQRVSELRVWEAPWREVRLPRLCLCDNSTLSSTGSRHLVFLSSSRVLEVAFTVRPLRVYDDFTNIYFSASFEMVRASPRGADCSRRQRLRGSGGEIQIPNGPRVTLDGRCEGLPWLVEAHENRSLFLLTWGSFLPLEPAPESARCHTRNRLLLYTGRPARLLRVVCPASPNARQYAVHVFSEEWFGEPAAQQVYLSPPRPASFLVEFVSREAGAASLSWLEISRPRASLRLLDAAPAPANDSAGLPTPPLVECPHKCPELNACISAALWCDGHPHCPSGYDEAHCRRLLALLPGGLYTLVGGGAGAAAAALAVALCVVAARRRRRRRRGRRGRQPGGGAGGVGGEKKQREPRRVPTEELLLDPGSTTSS